MDCVSGKRRFKEKLKAFHDITFPATLKAIKHRHHLSKGNISLWRNIPVPSPQFHLALRLCFGKLNATSKVLHQLLAAGADPALRAGPERWTSWEVAEACWAMLNSFVSHLHLHSPPSSLAHVRLRPGKANLETLHNFKYLKSVKFISFFPWGALLHLVNGKKVLGYLGCNRCKGLSMPNLSVWEALGFPEISTFLKQQPRPK